jgi:hypothetical protein
MELDALIHRIGTDDPPSDDELAGARTEAVSLLQAAVGGEHPDLETGRVLRRAIDDIDAELAARAEARTAAAAEASSLTEGLVAETPPDEEPDEDEPEPEPEPEAPEAEAASVSAAVRRARARVEADAMPDEPAHVRVNAVGPASSAPITASASWDDAGRVFHRFASAVGRGSRQALIRVEREYPESRLLGPSVVQNTRLIDAVTGPEAIVAAGGICDPLPADFTVPVFGNRGRPIRDALPTFGARGGVRFQTAISAADLAAGVDVWTAATDASPGTATKACLTVTCAAETEVTVDAITACLTIGNFQARFNPEYWAAHLQALAIAHDRLAEQTLFATMAGDATAVTATTEQGTARTVLMALDKAAAGIRSRLRLNETLRLVAPAWLRDAVRASLAAQGVGDGLDALTVADAQLNAFFASRMINPVWSLDLQVFSAEVAASALDNFAATALMLLYNEGAYLFVDGGTLDLGTEIMDSTLNATNDRQAFMETFEQVAFRGGEALAITAAVGEECVCPPVITT